VSNLVRIRQVEGFEVFRGEDGSEWIRDTDLAERAELAKSTNIRETIKGAIGDAAIGASGACPNKYPQYRMVTEHVVSGKGRATPTPVYYLNHAGALVVIQRMRTDKAIELQQAMAMVFVEVVEGRLATANHSLERAVQLSHEALASLAKFMQEGISDVRDKASAAYEEAKAARDDVASLRNEVRDGFDRITKRKDPSQATIQQHMEVCQAMYGGFCPICRNVKIVDNGDRTKEWTIEHFVRRDKNGSHETMPACRSCNLNALESDKPAQEPAFKEYQRLRANFPGPLFKTG
jgi:5-methylcytosine-specific restriction endonuclease McrA